jgi:hypothetical protein
MPLAKTTMTIAGLSLAAVAQPAFSQPVPTVPIVSPSAWTITTDAARGVVQIASTAKGGAARFVGGCSKFADPGFLGTFSGYRGTGLRTDGEVERVLFYVRGGDWQEAFSAQLRYSASSGTWEIVKALPPVFVNSFSRGGTLAVLNDGLKELFAFDLTGSTAAAKAMRQICGFQ